MKRVVLLLGSNEGDRSNYLGRALSMLAGKVGKPEFISGIYETRAWGNRDQAEYLNQVASFNTELSPESVLNTILSIEKLLGRVRKQKWAARTIDIDILFYDSEIIRKPDLEVPHPYLHERRFTLVPLAEILPDLVHPVLGRKVSELLAVCSDTLGVHPLNDAQEYK